MLAHRLLLASVLVSPVVDAFSTLPQASPFRKVSATALRAEKSSLKNDVLATLAAVGIWAASSGANAEVIRTMDFSMPSSYDNIATTTVDKDELTKEVATRKAKVPPKKVKAAPKKAPKTEGMKVQMPDMNFSLGASSDRKAAAKAAVAERKAQREAAEAEEKAAELKRAQELQESIKAAREAKIAAREAAMAEEAAASAAKSQGQGQS